MQEWTDREESLPGEGRLWLYLAVYIAVSLWPLMVTLTEQACELRP
jgi:hypothetical protein